MNKAFTIILMILVIMAGVISISCSKNEKNSETNGEIKTQDTNPAISPNQTIDAFSGKQVNKSIFADYKGKRIYFCCNQSKEDFNVNPEKYLTEFRRQGVTLEDSPEGK